MRVWSWGEGMEGPEEPDLELFTVITEQRVVVYDDDDQEWQRTAEGWVPTDPEMSDWDTPLHWSVLLEMLGPLRSKPRPSVPAPAVVDSEG